MKKIIDATIQMLEENRPVVWATVVSQEGSAPRSSGSRMIISEGHISLGSIGGGTLEAETIEAADILLEEKGDQLLSFSLTGKEVAAAGMICGGNVQVYLERITADALPFLKEFSTSFSRLDGVLFVTEIGKESTVFNDCHLLLARGKVISGELTVPAAVEDHLPSVEKGRVPVLLPLTGKEHQIYFEPIELPSTLYLFGGGHISLDLAWIAHRLGDEIIVVDDREEFANRERFPMATHLLVQAFDTALERITFGPHDDVVIVTRGHMYDLEILRQALKSSPRYIGMIGSRRKNRMIFEKLLEEGISQSQLDQVHAPIGLKIQAETPAEIAVSIVAELIQTRAQGHAEKIKNWHV
jgi:xanthine dehydrogenase accessory factor